MLRPYFMHHHNLLGPLCTAAWQTVREFMAATADDQAFRPGMVAAGVVVPLLFLAVLRYGNGGALPGRDGGGEGRGGGHGGRDGGTASSPAR